MVSRKYYYHSIQRQSRCKDHNYVLDTISGAGMDETYGTYVDDECFDIHGFDDEIDHDTDDVTDDDTDDDTNDDADDDTDDGGRGSRTPLPGGAEFIFQMMIYDETLILDLVLARMRILEEIRTRY